MKKTFPAYQRVARRLEALILDGTLAPGSKIPSERQLAEKLKLSRPLIREALKELRGRGIIETLHGQGSFVAEIVPAASDNNALTHLFKDHTRTLYDLLEVREVLEGQAAYFAATRATTKDLYRISKTFNAMDVSTTHGESQVNARQDHDFHRAISEASHNPVLVHTLQSLSQLVLNSVLASVNNLYHRPEQKEKIIDHHRQIYNAIIQRQSDQAKQAAMEHIRAVRNSLQDIEREEQRLIRAEMWSLDLGDK
ncbi:MAG: FCD domain-containing protein [Spongiibacteraceae bacterium]